MININNYISEKLHIDKDYKSVNNFDDFKDIFEKNGFILDKCLSSQGEEIYTIYPKKKKYPYFMITAFNTYWTEFGDDARDSDYFSKNCKSKNITIWRTRDIDDMYEANDFDLIEERGYAYTHDNIMKIIKCFQESMK